MPEASIQGKQAKKSRATKATGKKKSTRRLEIEEETEEEADKEQNLIQRKRKASVDIASESQQEASEVAKTSDKLQTLDSEETQKHLTRIMQVKQEAKGG